MYPPPLLEIDLLTKAFDGVQALRNGSFELRQGEIHALAGENGAGKSTLIKILSGILPRDGGHIRMDGMDAAIRSPTAARALGIAVIHQDFDLPPNLSVMESLLLGREPVYPCGFIRPGKSRKLVREYLGRIGLEIDPATPVTDLTVSQRQMLAIARAVSSNARILIMDEPTSALATDEIEQLLKLIQQLRKDGTSVIYISHKMEEIFRVSDRITVFRDGASAGTRETHKTSSDEIVSMMVGRDIEAMYTRTGRPCDSVLFEVRDIRKKGLFAGIDFELHRGEILGIYGLKGAGRSELMSVLFGLDEPDEGQILMEGRTVRIRSPKEAIKRSLAFLPEDRHVMGLFPNMSVEDNISISTIDRMVKYGFVIDRKEERIAADEYIGSLNIRTDDVDRPITNLSGGNQQKVLLARWLMTKPRVLILDEPTAGIDVGAKAEIYTLIDQLAGEGLGIILVSSELPEILGMCDRILVMHRNEIIGQFPRQEATEEGIMHVIHSTHDFAI